ncbi:MAG: DUF4384 domain-containing protein [Pirellulales bacterium]|nr:DUF4384 domain-containing protein [Pirellulales bacterium]
MKKYVILSMIALTLLPAMAPAQEEDGRVRTMPWSGYWWPQQKGEIVVPLSKYDQVNGTAAAQWEQQNKPSGEQAEAWAGYCHAWSASAVLEKEPKQPKQTRQVNFGVGDQKGLLAAAHARDVADVHGDRYGDGQGSEDMMDLAPDVLWHYLKFYIKQQQVPLICDIEAGSEVWNYPVYAYRIRYTPYGGGDQYLADLFLWMADDAVPPDYVGVETSMQSYQFTCRIRNGAIVAGSGQWVGSSVQNHPDFVWYPYVVMPENPHIEHAKVQQLCGFQPGTDSGPRPNPGTPGTGPGPGGPGPGGPGPGGPGFGPGPGGPGPGIPGPGPGGPNIPIAVSPIQMVAMIANKTSAFDFDITLDKFDGGHYAPGEMYQIRGHSAQDGFLYLLHIDSQGGMTLLNPLPGFDTVRVKAGESFQLPGPFLAAEPVGTHRIKAVVTSRRLALPGLMVTRQASLKKDQRAFFHWPPTQKQQVQGLLVQYQQKQKLQSKQFDGIDPTGVIGPFAQDEVAFYVGP